EKTHEAAAERTDRAVREMLAPRLEERHPLARAEERAPRRVDADRDDHVAEERRGPLDEIEVAESDRVEAPGINRETSDGSARGRHFFSTLPLDALSAGFDGVSEGFAGLSGVFVSGFFGSGFGSAFFGSGFGSAFFGSGFVSGFAGGGTVGSGSIGGFCAAPRGAFG